MDRARNGLKMDGYICLQCMDGFLTANGLENKRLFLKSPPLNETKDGSLPFFNFVNSVFRIVPTRTSLLNAAGKGAAGGESGSTAEIAVGGGATKKAKKKKASAAAAASGTGNDVAETANPMDSWNTTDVTYGVSFSLQHMASLLYVSVVHTQPSMNDPDCVSVTLVSEQAAASASCEFIFVSRYKMRSDGDVVSKEDEVLLRLAARPVFLHVSAPRVLEAAGDNLHEGDMELMNRTFRVAANYAMRRNSASRGLTLNAVDGSDDGALDGLRPDVITGDEMPSSLAVQSVMREYLDEVNGCEEGGIAFTLHRYDLGTDRANRQRAEQHIGHSYVACGVPLAIFHQERGSFLTTSVTYPRVMPEAPKIKSDDGSETETKLPMRQLNVNVTDIHMTTGSEGQIHFSPGGNDGEGSEESGEDGRRVKGPGSLGPSLSQNQHRLEEALLRQVKGLVDVGGQRRMPFPVFTALPDDRRERTNQDSSLNDNSTQVNTLWMFEYADPTVGGPVRQDGARAYRLKHIMTGLYLGVCGSAVDAMQDDELASDGVLASQPVSSDDDDNAKSDNGSLDGPPKGTGGGTPSLYSHATAPGIVRETALCLVTEPRNRRDMERTLFTVEPMFATECDWLIEQDYFVLKNTLTEMFVCTNSTVEGSDIRLSLQWQPCIADTLVVSYPPMETRANVLFLRDQCVCLARYRDQMQATVRMLKQQQAQVEKAAAAGDAAAQKKLAQAQQAEAKKAEMIKANRNGEDIDIPLMQRKGKYETAPHTAAPLPPVSDLYAHLTHTIDLCQRALCALIRFCVVSEEFNIFKLDGLPIQRHQRMLFDVHLYRLLFEVAVAPLALLDEGGMEMYGSGSSVAVAAAAGCQGSRAKLVELLADSQTQPIHSLWDLDTTDSNKRFRDRNKLSPQSTKQLRPPIPNLDTGLLRVQDLLLPEHHELHLLIRLVFCLLRQMCAKNSLLCEGWADYIPVFLSMDGYRLHVVDSMREMFTDNLRFPLSAVQAVCNYFISASQDRRKGLYLDFLGAACTVKYQGIPERQQFVYDSFLKVQPDFFCKFRLNEAKTKVEICPRTGSPWYPIDVFFTSNSKKEVEFVEYQIALLARLVYAGCPSVCREAVSKVFPREVVLVALRTLIYNPKETVGVKSDLDVLRSHILRIAMQVYVYHRIADPAVQLRVNTVLFGSSELRHKKADTLSGLEDDEMLQALKQVTIQVMRVNPFFVQSDVKRSTLLRSVVSIWLRLIRFKQYRVQELDEVIPLFYSLLDGKKDVMDIKSFQDLQLQLTVGGGATNNSSLNPQNSFGMSQSQFQSSPLQQPPTSGRLTAAQQEALRRRRAENQEERLNVSLASVHLQRIRQMICLALIAVVDNAVHESSDEMILYLHAIYTNHKPAQLPWLQGSQQEQGDSFSARVGQFLKTGSKDMTDATTALFMSAADAAEKPLEAGCCCRWCGGCRACCCCGRCCRGAGKNKTKAGAMRADGYTEVGSGGDDDELSSLEDRLEGSFMSTVENGTFADNAILHAIAASSTAQRRQQQEERELPPLSRAECSRCRQAEELSVSTRDIHAYLNFLTDKICNIMQPDQLVPLLLDVTRYDSNPLTVQAMRLLVHICLLKRCIAQQVLSVNTIPSIEVVRSFDAIYSVAVYLQQSLRTGLSYNEHWGNAIKVALSALLDSFDHEDETGVAATITRAAAEAKEQQSSPPLSHANSEYVAATRHAEIENSLRDIYSSFALSKKERRVFQAAEEEPVPHSLESASDHEEEDAHDFVPDVMSSEDKAAHLRQRTAALWAKTASATRMVVYSNTIRSRRRALGLNETSTVPMNIVVRAEIMAHWSVHETLLEMLGSVPPEDPAFFRIMKFFYFFTLSETNAKLLRKHVQLFIDLVPASRKTCALCLNIVATVLGTMRVVDSYLTKELLGAFATRIDGEAFTKLPDREFVELLSNKIFSKRTVGVVVRRRFMLIMRDHQTLRNLTRPRVRPTTIEVLFTSALMNLVCNICGSNVSVLTLAQGMLPADCISAIAIQVGRDQRFFKKNNEGAPGAGIEEAALTVSFLSDEMGSLVTAAAGGGEEGGGDGAAAAMKRSSSSQLAKKEASEAKAFKLINPYLRALVVLYFTSAVDHADDNKRHRVRWTTDSQWWEILHASSLHLRAVTEGVQRDLSSVVNRGIHVVLHYRTYFLRSICITAAAYFLNCFDLDTYFKNRAVIGNIFIDFCQSAEGFCEMIMQQRAVLELTVEEVVNYRRLLGVLQYLLENMCQPELSRILRELTATKNLMRTWLMEQQGELQEALLREKRVNDHLGFVDTNEDDTAAFDVLFHEETVSSQLQQGGGAMLMSNAAVSDESMMFAQVALRSVLRGNTLIPSVDKDTPDVALLINAYFLRSTSSLAVRETIARIMKAMNRNVFTARTFVGLLNLFYNALDTALHHEALYRRASQLQLIGFNEASFYPYGSAAQPDPDNPGYALQVVFNDVGMMSTVISISGLRDDVITYSALRLGIAILDGGNRTVQDALLHFCTTREEGFFHTMRYILRENHNWVEHINSEHQYYMLKRGMVLRGHMLGVSSVNIQLIEALIPKKPERVVNRATKEACAHVSLNGWARVRGARRLKTIQYVFRLLQLFCEGHNEGLQNYIRSQHDNLHSANMIHDVVSFMKEVSLYVTPANLQVVSQGFELLTETCQGPCRPNQEALISYDVCLMIGHVLQYISEQSLAAPQDRDLLNSLRESDMSQLRCSVSTTLLSLIEGCRDAAVYQRIAAQVPLRVLEAEIASVQPGMYYEITHNEAYEKDDHVTALFNWLIFLCSVRPYANELDGKHIDEIMRRCGALRHYLGSIEIRRADGLERVYFRIPQICLSLTQERKDVLLWNVDRTSRASKLADFLHKTDELIFAIEQVHNFTKRIRHYTRFKVVFPASHGNSSKRLALAAAKEVGNKAAMAVAAMVNPRSGSQPGSPSTGGGASSSGVISAVSSPALNQDVSLPTFAPANSLSLDSVPAAAAMDEDAEFSIVDTVKTKQQQDEEEMRRFYNFRTQMRIRFNNYVAPFLFSTEVAYYDGISMTVAIIANAMMMMAEGNPMLVASRSLFQEEQMMMNVLCVLQVVVCTALLYIEAAVGFPIRLYAEYKAKQRFAGAAAQLDVDIKVVYASFSWLEVLTSFLGWFTIQFRICLLFFAVLSVTVSHYFAAFNLMLLIYNISTLRTFISAITMNGKQLLLTSLLGIIILYLFSIVGFLRFSTSYDPDAEDGTKAQTNCDTLLHCFTYILSQGLRAGGGVGDVMRAWAFGEPQLLSRVTYEMLFYALVTVVFLNILFGIIIDTFGQMRDDKREKELDMHGNCFICGLDADVLEKLSPNGFHSHVKQEHNMWMYLYFIHHLRRKDPTEYTGQESYVQAKIQANSLAFFPDEDCLALTAAKADGATFLGGNDDDTNDDSDNDEDAGGETGGTGKGNDGGGKDGGAGRAGKLLEEMQATREGLQTCLKEFSADAQKVKALLQQMELMAKGSTGSGSAFGGKPANSGRSSGHSGSPFGPRRSFAGSVHTLAPGGTRAAAEMPAMGTSPTSGPSSATSGQRQQQRQLLQMEQQLGRTAQERQHLTEENARQRERLQGKELEIEQLRAQLADYAERKQQQQQTEPPAPAPAPAPAPQRREPQDDSDDGDDDDEAQ